MSDTSGTPAPDLLALTARIVSAQVRGSRTEPAALPSLIQAVFGALAGAGPAAEQPAQQRPAVPVKRSVFSDHLVCLEDGHKVQTLKRYLASRYGLTPEAYRAKWGLPANYPMVAPAYSERRSAIARKLGLGRARQAPVQAATVEVQQVPEGKRGTRKPRARPKTDAAPA